MHKKIVLSTLVALLVIALPVAADAKGKYTRFKDGHIEYFNEDRVTLTSLDNTAEQTLDLADFNASPPAECLTVATACEETTEIVVTTKKIWKPVKLEPITSEKLSSEKFAKYFPDLTSKKLINGSSPRDERLVTQRILHDVGLLPAMPTGKLGFLTELATLKLQCAAGFEEFSNGKAIIGEKTIAKLNELKDRLADPAAMAARPVPNRDFATCSPAIKHRAETINKLQDQVSAGQISGGTSGGSSSKHVAIPKPNFLNLEGEVTIKKN